MSDENRILYAIAAEHLTHKGWVAEIHYVHASNQASARYQFVAAYPKARVVGIAPSLGYFVDDKKGDKLSV
jgi:hypothetical protein